MPRGRGTCKTVLLSQLRAVSVLTGAKLLFEGGRCFINKQPCVDIKVGHFPLSEASAQTERLTSSHSFKRKGPWVPGELPLSLEAPNSGTWNPWVPSPSHGSRLCPLLGKGGKALIRPCPVGLFGFSFHMSHGRSEGVQLADPALICDAQCHSHGPQVALSVLGAREPRFRHWGGQGVPWRPSHPLSPGHTLSLPAAELTFRHS